MINDVKQVSIRLIKSPNNHIITVETYDKHFITHKSCELLDFDFFIIRNLINLNNINLDYFIFLIYRYTMYTCPFLL